MNGRGSAAARGMASGAASGGRTFLVLVSVLAAVAAVTGLVGVGLTSYYWVTNVHRVEGKISVDRDEIAELNLRVDQLNSSLPTGNATVFYDDEWLMLHAGGPTQQFMLNASLVGAGQTRNFAVPNLDGVLVVESQLPTGEFSESAFAVFGDPDSGQRLEFSLALYGPGPVTHLVQWPGKAGTVAMISDVVAIAGNTSVFLDDAFGLLSATDTSKRGGFNVSLVDPATNRTVWFPNLDGTMVLTEGNQTLSDKTLDTSNAVTLFDSLFTIDANGAPGTTAQFDLTQLTPSSAWTYALVDTTGTLLTVATGAGAGIVWPATTLLFRDSQFFLFDDGLGTRRITFQLSGVTGTRTFTAPDLDGTLMLTSGAQVVSGKSLDTTNIINVLDAALAIKDNGDPTKTLQFQCSGIGAGVTRVVTAPDLDGIMMLTTGVQTVSDKLLDFTNSALFQASNFAWSDDVDPTAQVQMDLSLVATATTQTLFAPDLTGVLMLTSGAQTVSDKTLDNTNNISVSDALFTIEGATADASFDASGLTSDRVYGLPDASGTLLLASQVTSSTSCTVVYGILSGFTGTPATATCQYIQVGNVVSFQLKTTGLSSGLGSGVRTIQFSVPLARTAGNFPNNANQASGTVVWRYSTSDDNDPGIVEAVPSSESLSSRIISSTASTTGTLYTSGSYSLA